MGQYHSQITKSEWRAAFIAEHGRSVPRMQAAFRAAGLDDAKVNWQQTADIVAADVFNFVWARISGGCAIRLLAALVGGRDPSRSQCVCGRC